MIFSTKAAYCLKAHCLLLKYCLSTSPLVSYHCFKNLGVIKACKVKSQKLVISLIKTTYWVKAVNIKNTNFYVKANINGNLHSDQSLSENRGMQTTVKIEHASISVTEYTIC